MWHASRWAACSIYSVRRPTWCAWSRIAWIATATPADVRSSSSLLSRSCKLTVDAARVARVVDNLLSNAVKYSPDESAIWVRLGQEEGPAGPQVVLSVRDEGIGIPAADLPHIFDRFARARNVIGHISGHGYRPG